MEGFDALMVNDALARWRSLAAADPTPSALQDFHARHKMLLLTRGPAPMRELGRLAASSGDGFASALRAYGDLLARTLTRAPSIGGHVDALQHLVGHLPPGSSPRAEAAALVAGFRDGRVSFEDAREGLRARLTDTGTEWARAQAYLSGD